MRKPDDTKLCNGGIQHIYHFNNGYGASVVRHPYSYGGDKGLWELAVLKFKGKSKTDYKIAYNTSITSDVKGYLTDADVDALLLRIEKLP